LAPRQFCWKPGLIPHFLFEFSSSFQSSIFENQCLKVTDLGPRNFLLILSSEYFADLSTSSYFLFLDAVAESSSTLTSATEQQHASFAFDFLRHQLMSRKSSNPLLQSEGSEPSSSSSSALALAGLQTALALSVNTPKV
jgi:hypothetical protein